MKSIYGLSLPWHPTPEGRKKLNLGPPYSEDVVQETLEAARECELFPKDPSILLEAIDPATGDSVFHIAARLGSKSLMNAIIDSFPPFTQRIWPFARHALLAHRNHQGDTVLHVAARTGSPHIVIMVYRYIHNHWSSIAPEITEMDDGPPENLPYYEIDEITLAESLLHLTIKNNSGRDPASEARFLGYPEVAGWLEAIRLRLDPTGIRCQGAGITSMTNDIQNYYCYKDMLSLGGQTGYNE